MSDQTEEISENVKERETEAKSSETRSLVVGDQEEVMSKKTSMEDKENIGKKDSAEIIEPSNAETSVEGTEAEQISGIANSQNPSFEQQGKDSLIEQKQKSLLDESSKEHDYLRGSKNAEIDEQELYLEEKSDLDETKQGSLWSFDEYVVDREVDEASDKEETSDNAEDVAEEVRISEEPPRDFGRIEGPCAGECAARTAIDSIVPASRYFHSKTPETPAPLMLGPDHSLMARFQATLRDHLTRQKEKLLSEISDLRANVRLAEKEEEELGVSLFVQNKDLALQRKIIDDRQSRLGELAEEKLKLENELKQLKEDVKMERAKYERELREEHELRMERDKMRLLEKKMVDWKADVENDLAVNLRISEKTEAERRRMLEENRKLDMYILRLMTEINKLESESVLLNDQLEQKENEKELLNQTVADANADLQDLANDQKRLLSDWHNLVVATAQRDNAYGEVVQELHSSEEAFRTLTTEIDSFKKSAQDEMRRSEELGYMYGKAKNELENYSRKQKELLLKKAELERIVVTTTELAQQASRDLQLAEMQSTMKEQELVSVQKELQTQMREKQAAEDHCLDLIIEQSTNDKTAMHLNKEVKGLRMNVREQETQLMELENKMSRLIMQTEDVKLQTGRNLEILNEMNKEIDSNESVLGLCFARTKDISVQLDNRQMKLIELTKKIEELNVIAGLSEMGMSTLEVRVRDLDWALRDLKKENDLLQSEWMRQQSLNVKLSKQRSECQKEVSLLRKQVILLDQKHIKLNKDLEREQRIEVEIRKTIEGLHHRLKNLSVALSAKTDHRHVADRDLLLQQTAFVHSLKEAENEQMQLKREIADLERLLEERADVMLEVQREMLAWEKKYKLALETKQNIEKEKSSQGEIGQMKAEINRMEIRYSQLRKVQEKLIVDMEGTIRRREAIVEEADARDKRDQSTNRSRANFQRKLNELENRIKMIRQEEKMIDSLLAEAEGNHQDLVNQLNEKSEQVRQLKDQLIDIAARMEDGQLKYQHSVEVLVRRQRRCKMLANVKGGKYRPIHRNEILLENDLGLAKTSNCDISAILEALMGDFPALKHTFARILTSLKPDVI